MEPFEAIDFYDIESLLTEEEIMIRDLVREWVDEEVIPKIEHACEKGIFLDEWRVALGEMGVLGAPLKGYGCPGLSYVAYGLICQRTGAWRFRTSFLCLCSRFTRHVSNMGLWK